jgi:hypothetical protein
VNTTGSVVYDGSMMDELYNAVLGFEDTVVAVDVVAGLMGTPHIIDSLDLVYSYSTDDLEWVAEDISELTSAGVTPAAIACNYADLLWLVDD